MNNYMAVLEYDGTCYFGFQIQPGVKTIEGELVKAISTLLRENVEISYAGRTDAGVHATHQVINFKVDKDLNLYEFKWRLNSILPEDIVVKEISRVDSVFDARKSAKWREYSYLVVNGNYQSVFLKRYSILVVKDLDLRLMRKAAKMLVGEKDFKSFCSSESKDGNTVRKIRSFTVDKLKDNLLVFKVVANSFLQHMVRIMVGTILEIGIGKRDLTSLKTALNGKDRKLAGKTAPAKGLFLTNVVY
ncbi:MAG: tRNA pseudouridine(38-40) synthase TruA [Actinobacteria bacterium]|nr:tRNA pseudouridine(38-40) synthase TruA [Actinomycetota bacterium]